MDVAFSQVLLDYNCWANHLVMNQAKEVEESHYHAVVDGLSFGSLHATLVHILVGELVWVARWKGGLPPERLKDARIADQLAETEISTFEALADLWRNEGGSTAALLCVFDGRDGLRDRRLRGPVW